MRTRLDETQNKEAHTRRVFLFPNLLFGERCTHFLWSSVRRSVCLFVAGGSGLLSSQEAGLLLSDAVLPLAQGQFRTVPPETHDIPETWSEWLWYKARIKHVGNPRATLCCPLVATRGVWRLDNERVKLTDSPLLLHLLLGLLLVHRVLADSSVSLLVHFLHLQQTRVRVTQLLKQPQLESRSNRIFLLCLKYNPEGFCFNTQCFWGGFLRPLRTRFNFKMELINSHSLIN